MLERFEKGYLSQFGASLAFGEPQILAKLDVWGYFSPGVQEVLPGARLAAHPTHVPVIYVCFLRSVDVILVTVGHTI